MMIGMDHTTEAITGEMIADILPMRIEIATTGGVIQTARRGEALHFT